MPRTKKTEAESLSPAEPIKRKAPVSKPAAVNHKHTTKKSLTPELAAPVRVIKSEEIALLAYSYWESRGGQGGSPQDDWFRAEMELKSQA